MVIALVCLYLNWVSFIYFLLGSRGEEISYIAVLINPSSVLWVIQQWVAVAEFHFNNDVIKGSAYIFILSLEAIGYFAIAYLQAPKIAGAYCENCQRWCYYQRMQGNIDINIIPLLEKTMETGEVRQNCHLLVFILYTVAQRNQNRGHHEGVPTYLLVGAALCRPPLMVFTVVINYYLVMTIFLCKSLK